jgi:hypothetical protein
VTLVTLNRPFSLFSREKGVREKDDRGAGRQRRQRRVATDRTINFGCPGDLDNDGDTDLADLGILLADFGCAP